MSQPTFSRIPASTASGMPSAKGARPRTSAKRTREWSAPEIGVLPPARTLTTVRMVAPAPGMPPRSPAMTLPMPWPISFRLDLCWVRVTLSAIREVSKLSIEPSTARTSAACTMPGNRSSSIAGIWRSGKPRGISPITGAPDRTKMPISVLMTRAASGGEISRRSRPGMKSMMASARRPTISASKTGWLTTLGSLASAPMTPPDEPVKPNKGKSCRTMMMQPMPLMKPEMTEKRHIGDVTPELQPAEHDLQQTARHDNGKGFRRVAGVLHDDTRHDHGHGRCRT